MCEGPIARGRAALAACDWAGAAACFEEALAAEASAAALDGLGQARYWQGDYDRALTLRAQAYAAYRGAGEERAAARVAIELGALHLWVRGEAIASEGWVGHAARLLDGAEDGVEHGWLELLLAGLAADPVEQERRARRAGEAGRRHGDAGLEYDALGHVGLALVRQGRVAEGMRCVDESVAAVSSGLVADPWPAGEIYCSLFGACEVALDVRRAEAWLGSVDGYVRRTGELPVAAICRAHYGGVLVSAGRWADAERELSAARELYGRSWRGSRHEAEARLADLRARQGRLDEAHELLRGQEDAAEAAAPLARLHLAAGEPALAERVLERCLARRGRGLASAPLLALLVEALLADGRAGTAGEVAAELAALGEACGQPAVVGLAALAQALVGASRSPGDDEASADVAAPGGADDAVAALLERALASLLDAGLAHEAARARLLLADRLAAARPDVARGEARAALERLERLPARLDVAAAAALLRRLEGDEGAAAPLTGREAEVLALLAEGCSNAELAARLHISVRTAEDHVGNILRKLGLANRTEAAAYALRRGALRGGADPA